MTLFGKLQRAERQYLAARRAYIQTGVLFDKAALTLMDNRREARDQAAYEWRKEYERALRELVG